MKLLVLCLLSMLISSNSGANINCRTDPTTDDDQQTVDDGSSFTISCDIAGSGGNTQQDHIQACSWQHYEPLNENRGQTYAPDLECTYSSSTSTNCVGSSYGDSRVTGMVNTGSCQIQVSNSKPEDTGEWKATVTTANSNSKLTQTIEIWTYNMSYVEILDDSEGNRDHRSSIDTSYNYDDKQEDWEDNKSGWETVELVCYAAGGRPLPKFTWQINNNDLDDDDVFDNPSASNGDQGNVYRGYGYDNVIQDMEASLKFQVDDNLLSRLRDKHNIDTNPDGGDFTFDIECIVEQDGIQTSNEKVRVDVQKTYDDGHLKGSMIGIIVGVIVAVIILVAAIALLIFAKTSGIWCFADDDYQHKDIQTSRPRGPGPQQPQQQQVHNRGAALDRLEPAVIPASTKISTTSPNNSKPPISSRRSSTSSGNVNTTTAANVGTNATFPRVQGEWIDQRDVEQSSRPTIIKTHKQASKRSTTSGHSTGSSTSNNMTNTLPPTRPPKPSELQYANLDRNFMDNPRNQVLPTVINVNSPAGATANPSFNQSSITSPYATIVSSSVRSSEQRVNGELVSQTVQREEYRN